MEQETYERNHSTGVLPRLGRGAVDSILNVPRVIGEFLFFDPDPNAISNIKPGLLSVIQQIRQERSTKQ